MPINVRYLHLDLSKHVVRNISRFRLRAHTLKVEAAAWHEDGSCVCDQCPGGLLSELLDLFVAGRDQSAADQPNNLAEGHPPLQPL